MNEIPPKFIDIDIDSYDQPSEAGSSNALYREKVASGQDSEFLEILCNSLDVGVSILDENLNYQFIGDAVYKSLNISTNELRVGDHLSRCHELMLENGMLTEALIEANKLSSEAHLTQTQTDKTREQSIMKLGNGTSYSFTRKTLPNGYTVSMANDITELIEKDELLNEALALGKAGYWTYDPKAKNYTISPTMKSILSKEQISQFATEGIFALLHPEDRPAAKDAVQNAKNTDNKFEYVARIKTASGKYSWGSTHGDILYDQDGRPSNVRAFVVNIEKERQQAKELERAKDEAIAASHAKSEFLANMSHEIRTPMNGVLGMAELLANSEINDRQREFVNVINNSATALLTIINDILDFSKIEAGAFELDPTPFDLKSSINDVTSMLCSHAQDKGLELIINYPSDAGQHFIGDGGRIRQVITNLVGNAIKFTETGYILINVDVKKVRDNSAIVTIDVIDSGIGIETEKLARIFHKFTQADGSTTRLYGGTGLGLSISKAIIEMMGGRMSAQSELGKGSTFRARFPLETDTQAILETYDNTVLQDKYVLIVDDIQVNQHILQEQVGSWGMKSDSAKNSEDALRYLEESKVNKTPYDLIILDFLMPGMDGKELATLISQKDEYKNIPMVMLSSCDQPISTADLKAIGIENYLIKPAREKRLHEAIVKAIKPRAITKESEAKADQLDAQQPSSKIEILVAEDFSLNQEVVKLMLADTDYKPIFANNGQEAAELYKADPSRFPVIIMDVSMPVMDGREATSVIQNYEAQNDIKPTPIIALTGHALKNDRDECFKAGMCDYLSKPVKQSELLKVLDLWVKGNKENKHALSA